MSCSALPLAAVGHVDGNREHELFYNFPCENRAAFFCSAPSCLLRSSAFQPGSAVLCPAMASETRPRPGPARPLPLEVGVCPVPGAAAAALQLTNLANFLRPLAPRRTIRLPRLPKRQLSRGTGASGNRHLKVRHVGDRSKGGGSRRRRGKGTQGPAWGQT